MRHFHTLVIQIKSLHLIWTYIFHAKAVKSLYAITLLCQNFIKQWNSCNLQTFITGRNYYSTLFLMHSNKINIWHTQDRPHPLSLFPLWNMHYISKWYHWLITMHLKELQCINVPIVYRKLYLLDHSTCSIRYSDAKQAELVALKWQNSYHTASYLHCWSTQDNRCMVDRVLENL